MHYGPTTFSVNRVLPTLTPVVAGTRMNSSTRLTTQDSQFINQIYPNVGVVRRVDSSPGGAGEVKQITVARDDLTPTVVTAVVTKTDTLLLIQWQVDALGGLLRLNDSGIQAGNASHISIARGNAYVTAVRSGSGNLLLISWNVGPNGIQRLNDSGDQAGNATLCRIVKLSATTFLTACRAENGNLLLLTWKANTNGSFTRLATSEAGAVSEISLTRLKKSGSNQLVATTVRAADGRVLSIVWAISSNGNNIARRGDSGTAMGEATQVSSVWSKNQLVVSCKTESGNLLVMTFSVSGDGSTINRLSDSGNQAGKISENAMIARPYGVLSAVRASTGNLLLIKWQQSSNGTLSRFGDSGTDQAGTASNVTVGPLLPILGTNNAPIVTSIRDSTGKLLLITWDDQPRQGEV
jgi:hypothetical protein